MHDDSLPRHPIFIKPMKTKTPPYNKKGALIDYCFAPHKLQFPMEISSSHHLLHLVFIFIFFLLQSALAADVYTEALLSLKSNLVNSETGLKDWSLAPGGGHMIDGIVACLWPGVSCDRNSTVVLGLDLSGKNLGGELSGKDLSVFSKLVDLNLSYNSFSGELPREIFNLTDLKSLDISQNNFSGQFPGGISRLKSLVVLDAFSNSFSGPLPAEVSELDYLKVLNLAGSYFNGPIPSEYGNFNSIEFIHLAGNYLSGNIPPELGKIRTVNHMEIGYNSYQGSIPWQIGNMSGIEYLDIADANLSGSIPSQISNLTRLKSLFLFRNQLAGPIPPELGTIASLVDLDLSDNLISGSIPGSFSELGNLSLLSLMYNEMSGTVPESIAELPSLETLLIWNNYFSGTLPKGLGRNTRLKWVDVSTNNLVGPIPPDICSGGVLFKLILFSNGFNDSNLLPSLSNCSSLVRLRLEENLFSGMIPLNFSLLPDISYVDLSRNRFTGGIPLDIHRAWKLQYFNVSHNPGLGGVTPVSVWSSLALQNFSASSCNITGEIPVFESCRAVSVIELSNNDLSGSIPVSVSDCKYLERIDLSNNRLSGHLPEEVAGLPDLEYLDVSHNNFTGPLPLKFGNAKTLKLLNVSYNDFTGRIPSEKAFASMGSSAFYGNTKLCGWPLRACPGSVAILGSKGTGKLLLVLLLCGSIVVAAMLVLGIVYVRLKGGARGRWKMVCFDGLPEFKSDVISRSLSRAGLNEICKAIVLPTGNAVTVKRIGCDAKRMDELLQVVTGMGNARHENLVRLLGFCYDKDLAYLISDHLPNGNLAEHIRTRTLKRDWTSKRRIIVGIARGLCFLHQDCFPLIPHGDLNSSNVAFDENMQPRLTNFGLRLLTDFNTPAKEQQSRDVYGLGEIILEVLSKGKLTSAAGELAQAKPKDMLLREIWDENEVGGDESLQEELKLMLEVALMCTKSRPGDRPSIEEALKLLSRPKD